MITRIALAISHKMCIVSPDHSTRRGRFQVFSVRWESPFDLCQKRHTRRLSPSHMDSMRCPIRVLIFAIVIGLVAALPLAVRPVAAHEQVTAGEYELTVGWRDEPAVAGYVNGL